MWNCSWSKRAENKQCMFLHPLNPVSYFCGYHSLCYCLISCHVYRIHLVCYPEPAANHRGLGAQGERGLRAALDSAKHHGEGTTNGNVSGTEQSWELESPVEQKAINQRESVHTSATEGSDTRCCCGFPGRLNCSVIRFKPFLLCRSISKQ